MAPKTVVAANEVQFNIRQMLSQYNITLPVPATCQQVMDKLLEASPANFRFGSELVLQTCENWEVKTKKYVTVQPNTVYAEGGTIVKLNCPAPGLDYEITNEFADEGEPISLTRSGAILTLKFRTAAEATEAVEVLEDQYNMINAEALKKEQAKAAEAAAKLAKMEAKLKKKEGGASSSAAAVADDEFVDDKDVVQLKGKAKKEKK